MTDFIEKKELFKEFYALNYNKLLNAEKSFRNLIHLLLSNTSEITTPKVTSRLKDRNEAIEKFNLKYRKVLEEKENDYHIREHITDLIGVRVICLYESDIEKVVTLLRENFECLDITDKSTQLMKQTNQFGYKGVHLDLRLSKNRKKLPEYLGIENFKFEVQVRSIVQDAWSEIDHKLKYKKSLSTNLQRRVINLAALFEMADREFDAIKEETIKEFEESKKQAKLDSIANTKLTPFTLYNFMEDEFLEFDFVDYKIEGFLYEVLELKEITVGDFLKAYHTHSKTINDYKDFREENFGDRFNPFTFMRHVLYLNNSRIFKFLLFNLQRDNFNEWLSDNK